MNRHRVFFSLFVAVLLALRAAVPMGYMPTFQDGKVRLIVCSSQGPQAVWVDKKQTPHHHQQKDTPHHTSHKPAACDFALSAAFAVPDAPPMPLHPVASLILPAAPFATSFITATVANHAARPRAPPVVQTITI